SAGFFLPAEKSRDYQIDHQTMCAIQWTFMLVRGCRWTGRFFPRAAHHGSYSLSGRLGTDHKSALSALLRRH
ncbi:hypothetical protein, partial [Pseudomonas sp. P5_A2_2]